MAERLKFAPSDHARWSVCTASPAAVVGVKRKSSKNAEAGNIAHELHALCLVFGCSAREYIGSEINVDRQGMCLVDADTALAVEQSIEYVLDQTAGMMVAVEELVDLDWLLPGQKGRVDVAAWDAGPGTKVLKILDYKNGKGVKNEAEGHGELMLHALGAMRTLLSYEQRKTLEKIELHIMQPNMNHFDKWETTKGELEQFAMETRGQYLKALDPDTREFVPSVEGCRWCPLKPDCRALRDSVLGKVMADPSGVAMELLDPARLTPLEAAELYEWLDFISAWAGNVKDHMRGQAITGVTYPGLKLVEGSGGKRDWLSREAAVNYMQSLKLSDLEMYDQQLISPPQFEKLMGKKKVGEGFEKVVKRRAPPPLLVREDAPGVPFKGANINEFDDTEN